MRKRYLLFLMLAASLPAFLFTNMPSASNATVQPRTTTAETINIDGDLSFSPEQNKIRWNPHAVGLTNASKWRITFNNETEMQLMTSPTETGHIAAGAWWTTSFKSKEKIPLYASKPIGIASSFRINVLNADLNSGNEWLRIALACAIQRIDGSVAYTEMDLWDSPTALAHPSGNTRLGGNIVYQGGDVVEYKIDQTTIGQWKNYSLNLTNQINDAWQLKPGDVLESVYFVVEAAGAVTATVRADDLRIARLD